jgi:hypothetical protein
MKIDPYAPHAKIASLYAGLASTDGDKFTVKESYEGGFELDLNGEAYAGGSYDILLGGNIFLASAGNALNRVVAKWSRNKSYGMDDGKISITIPTPDLVAVG